MKVGESTDTFGRPSISEGMKRQVEDAFKVVPSDKRSAVLVIVDERGARAHLAARLNGQWKVAGGAAFPWVGEEKPSGWVGIVGAWGSTHKKGGA